MGTPSSLNEAQQRHLLVSIEHADTLLSEIEQILRAASSKTPFPKYRVDVTPAQGKVVDDYIARIRAQMLRVLEGQGIRPSGPQLGAAHSIRVNLAFIRIALTEIGPRYMTGYGAVPESAAAELNGLVAELNALVDKLDGYLAQGLGPDLAERLKKLEVSGDQPAILAKIERIITAQGLVELRLPLEMILNRLESERFEIAVFGRVSSGKSSLLNHILDVDALPVGVNPITAVPTRLVWGPKPRLTVSFADRRVERYDIDALPDFATEQRNHGNSKAVTRIVVELPAKRLAQGVAFVDTPGLGSLATSGAAETRAYLPQCDLGVVLIDAASTLNEEDLATIQALYESGVPAGVLLSKADLLSPADRESVRNYIVEQIRAHLDVSLEVHPVSIVGDCAVLLDNWFNSRIAPLYAQHQQLARESVGRKIGALRKAVEAALQSRLTRVQGAVTDADALREAESKLRRAAGLVPEALSSCLNIVDEIKDLAPTAFRLAATRVVDRWLAGEDGEWAVIAAAFGDVARNSAHKVYLVLERVAEALTEALQRSAKALNLTEPLQEDDFTSILREMPHLDLGAVGPPLKRSRFVGFANTLVRARVESRLRQAFGDTVSQAFQSYRKSLEAWLRARVAEMQARFDSHADAYRAQLDNLIGSSAVDPSGMAAIRRDLEELERA
jgi:GTP-binding protein EngB required for normal cell division